VRSCFGQVSWNLILPDFAKNCLTLVAKKFFSAWRKSWCCVAGKPTYIWNNPDFNQVFDEIGGNRRSPGMSLQAKLNELKEGTLSQLNPEEVAVMEAATEELVRSGIAERAKKVGDEAPDFALPNASSEMVQLWALLAKGPVVLTFYRGTW
jgi:hypothetical protein